MRARAAYGLASVMAMLLLLSCSGQGPIAGGSGAGNPGGPATFAIVADTTISRSGLRKARSATDTASIHIRSRDGLVLSVESASLVVREIEFVLDSSPLCSGLPEPAAGALRCDSQTVILSGPFTFDLFSGMSTPRIDGLHLPESEYIGVRLHVAGEGICAGEEAGCFSLQLKGSFTYKDTLRPFLVQVAPDVAKLYKHSDPPILVTQGDTTHLAVRLDAGTWLQNIAIKECLDGGFVGLSSEGRLVIDEQSGNGECKNIGSIIWVNLVESGILYRRTDKATP